MDPKKQTVPVGKAAAKPRRATKSATAKTLPGLPSDPKPAPQPVPASVVAKADPAPSVGASRPLDPPEAKPVPVAEKPVAPAAKAADPAPAPKVEAPKAKPVAATPAPAVKPEAPEPKALEPKAVKAAKPAPAPKPAQAPKPAVPAATLSSPTAAVSADSKPKDIIMEATSTIENATAKAQAFFGDAQARTQAAMEKSSKLFEDLIAFNKDNLEAVVESSKIAAKGAESLGQGAADYAKRSFETATQTLQTLSSVKSPTEFLKLQSDFARSAFDSMVSETSRSTETVIKLAGEIAQPLSNRFAVAAEKIKTVA
ncbi:TIGR01841 family phasin [Sphingomonas sp.]|uniref:phasin family protein n=1 Tax=Sphingomonas sp. TaxID=28214 RepID=UPI0031E2EBBF